MQPLPLNQIAALYHFEYFSLEVEVVQNQLGQA
jgi:hypothetical protein